MVKKRLMQITNSNECNSYKLMQYLEVFFVREVDQKTLTHWLNHLAKGTDTRSNSQITEVRDEKF